MFDRLRAVSGLCLLSLSIASPGFGQSKPIDEMSLEELLSIEVSVASMKATTAREAPGIVTLITSDEIEASGARDLTDILRLVPGFDFGIDVQGIVGVGVRGNWAHEGKLLLLLDGLEMNEPLYSTLQFGNRIMVDQIERIEIIRGPGSSIYGGFAELGVVNIVTKSAALLHGIEATLLAGEMSDAAARRTISASGGKAWATSSITAHASWSEGVRSDAVYTDMNGDSYPMGDNSALDSRMLNVAYTSGNFSARGIADQYHITERDHFGENLPRATAIDFDSYLVEAKWMRKLGEKATILPRFTFKRQTPWNEKDEFFFYDKTIDRYVGTLGLSYDFTPTFNTLSGIEYGRDDASVGGATDPADYFANGSRSVSYSNFVLFTQAVASTRFGNATAGARYENHSEFGSSFVPRIGLTKLFNRFHLKALASRAFRAPGIENIRLGQDIEPENTTVFEVEGGYQLGTASFLVANAFHSRIKKPIVYFVDPVTEEEGYVNLEQTGTSGVEVEYRFRPAWGHFNASYSYYQAADNRVTSYEVPGNSDYLLAFPAHKLTLTGTLPIGSRLKLTPSIIHYGKRYGYDLGASGEAEVREFDPETIVNVYFATARPLSGHFNVGLGVFDLFDEGHVFIQPYDSLHMPLPDTTREVVLKIGYRSRS